MSLSFTVTPGHAFPAGRPITMPALRLAATPGLAFTGAVATGDLANGAVTPAKTTPGAYFYGAAAGTNAYAVTLSPALGAYADGAHIWVKFTNANTAAPSLDVSSLGAKNIYHRSGQVPKANDLPANEIFELVYNSSRNAGAGGWDILAKVPNDVIRFGTIAGTAGAITFATNNTAPVTQLAALTGQLLVLKATLANTAAPTLAVDGLAAKPIRKRNNLALLAEDIRLNEHLLLTYDAVADVFLALNLDVPTAVIGSTRGLVIQNNAATPNSKVDISADEVVLKTSDGQPYLAAAVAVTADIGLTAGNPNALDTGAEAASTWYYVWLIYNGTTVASLLSLSATTPTLPSGYLYRALLGAVRNDGSSNFIRFVQHDRQTWIDDTNIFTAKAAVADNVWEILAGADLTAFQGAVPPIARRCSGSLGWTATAAGGKVAISACNADGSVNTTNAIGAVSVVAAPNGTSWNTWTTAAPFEVPVRSGNLQWRKDTTAAQARLSVSGFAF